jgi:cytidylate kinase
MSKVPDHIVEALARLHRYAASQPSAPQSTKLLTIAISRQAGARGPEIARAVGARLGWTVYDHELLTHIAEEKGLHARLLEHLDERRVSWLEEMMASFSTGPGPLEGTYLKHLLGLFTLLGKTGHCVIVGRGAAHVLAAETTLRVRLVAPHAVRVAHTQKRLNLTKAEAERWVDKTDAERSRFVKRLFHADISDPLGYDLVLNSGRYNTDDCAAIIVEAARLQERRLVS